MNVSIVNPYSGHLWNVMRSYLFLLSRGCRGTDVSLIWLMKNMILGCKKEFRTFKRRRHLWAVKSTGAQYNCPEGLRYVSWNVSEAMQLSLSGAVKFYSDGVVWVYTWSRTTQQFPWRLSCGLSDVVLILACFLQKGALSESKSEAALDACQLKTKLVK